MTAVFEEIVIENLGVIRAATIPLRPGLTVITGETGAGKTMILTGLGLLMGGKADAAMVAPGASVATVEGTLHIPPSAAAVVEEAGGHIDDDGTVIAVRTVAAEGRSRAHIAGRSVPQALLAQITADLVTVHGQSDQMRLRTAAHQRLALDTFAGVEHQSRLEEYREAWARRVEIESLIEDVEQSSAERAREAELLRLGLAEVERVDPEPGEDARLTELIDRLSHSEELRAAAQFAHGAIAGEETADEAFSAVDLIDRARRSLESVAHTDPVLGDLAERLASTGYALADVGQAIAGYVEDIDSDPGALETAQERRAALGSLRAYGATIDEVLEWASRAGLRLLDLDDDPGRLLALGEERDQLSARLAQLAAQLTEARTVAAERLSATVTQELRGLAMSGASLVVQVAVQDELGPFGADTITFLLVPHPGAPPRPLGKGASGGELSRVMLAIEVALASAGVAGSLPMFVFDEVDAGVGGRAATEVGQRLAELAGRAQVVVVTHLAQVAAFATTHLVVAKSTEYRDERPVTVTGVHEVADEDRVVELARMLSGNDSDVAREHARELIHSALVGR